MPKVSVIMGAYNCEKTIKRAIDSIINQTFQDWECIICDDGSTDNTWELLKQLTYGNSKFILIQNKRNSGLAASLNKCISVASGKYLARQDADDKSISTRLEEQVAFLDNNKDISVVGSYASLFDKNGQIWGKIMPPKVPLMVDWVKSATILHATVLMRREDIISVGQYNERAIRVEDYDLWLRLIAQGYKIRTLPKILYLVHWDKADYGRRRLRYRIIEMKVRFNGYRLLRLPVLNYLYVCKPLITGMIPKNLMYFYHRRRFGNEV